MQRRTTRLATNVPIFDCARDVRSRRLAWSRPPRVQMTGTHMTTRDTIDRRALLATGVAAWSAVALGGCSDDASGGGTGGAGTGGAAGSGGATAAGGMNTAGSSAGSGPLGGSAGAGAGFAGQAGMAGAGTSGAAGSGMAGGGLGGGGSGGMGEAAGTGGAPPVTTCESMVSQAGTSMHTHPLTIPGGDVDQGYPSTDYYVLEDGGTGHTHTVIFTAYDFLYLRDGMPAMKESSTDMDHSHNCTVTCKSG